MIMTHVGYRNMYPSGSTELLADTHLGYRLIFTP